MFLFMANLREFCKNILQQTDETIEATKRQKYDDS